MKISKLLPVVCVLATANFSSIRADDTPAQAAARAALEQKLSEVGQQPANMGSDMNAQMPPPKKADEQVTMTPINDKEAKANAKAEAKEKKAAEAKQAAADWKAKKEAEKTKMEADKKLAAQRKMEAKENSHPMITNPSTSPTDDSAQRAAQRAALANATGNPMPAQNGNQGGNVNQSGKELEMQPLTAPPLPISASKEEKLQALLNQYKANVISPEEYHKQREAILAAP